MMSGFVVGAVTRHRRSSAYPLLAMMNGGERTQDLTSPTHGRAISVVVGALMAAAVVFVAGCGGRSHSSIPTGGAGGRSDGAGGTSGVGGASDARTGGRGGAGAGGIAATGGGSTAGAGGGGAGSGGGAGAGAGSGFGGAGGAAGSPTGAVGGAATGGVGGAAAGGGAGAGPPITCGSSTCDATTSFCRSYIGGIPGSTTSYSCVGFSGACSADRTCACVCPPSSNPAIGCVYPGGLSGHCNCGDSNGVRISCAGQ